MSASSTARRRIVLSRTLVAASLSLLSACGSSEPESAALAPFGAGPLTAESDAANVRTVLLVALDGVRAGDIERPVGELPALPHFDSLRASSVVAPDIHCAMTAGNGAMATLLTGLHGREHGVLSVRDLGRTRLDPSVPALQASFQEQGWRTLMSLPEARLGRGVGGFARGVDTFAAPRPGEPAWTADGVVNAVEADLEAAFADEGERVFCVISFGDALRSKPGPVELPEARLAAPLIRARMAPFAGKRAEIASAIERLENEPVEAIDDLSRLFSRSRGSAPGLAWHAARMDMQLARMDRALGRILALLESKGRAEGAAVVVCGLRGRTERTSAPGGGARFQGDVTRVPLWLRLPGAQSAPPAPADTTCIAPWLAGRLNLTLQESAFSSSYPRFARIAGPRGKLHALRTDVTHFERYPDGEIVAFGLDGDATAEATAGDDAARSELRVFAAPPSLEIRPAPDAAAFEAVWSLSSGSLVPRAGDRRPPPVRGRDALAETVEMSLTERAASARFGLRGPGAAPSKLIVGNTPAVDLPLLFLPLEAGPAVAEGEEPKVEILRSSGLAWSMTVRGAGKAELLLSVWPPREPTDAIEIPASNVRVSPVPGREELIHLSGELPFDILLKKMGKEDFAIACLTEEGFVAPREMAADGSWFAGPDAFDVWLPAWQPAVSAGLSDVTAALYGEVASAPPGSVTVHRGGYGPVPSAESALDFDALELLRTLPAGE